MPKTKGFLKGQKRCGMDWQITFLIFTACASGHIFYQLGKKQGISSTLDYLKADGQIDFDED